VLFDAAAVYHLALRAAEGCTLGVELLEVGARAQHSTLSRALQHWMSPWGRPRSTPGIW